MDIEKINRETELVKNTFVLSVGKMLPKVAAFITLPILTGCLTKAEYGTYDLITTLIMLVMPIATLQIQSAAFRFLIDVRKNIDRTCEIITNIFAVTVPITFFTSLIISIFFGDTSYLVRILTGLYFFFDTIQLTLGQITRGLGKNKEYSIASILLSIVNMVLVVMAVYFEGLGLLGVMIALLGSQIVGTIYFSVKIHIFKYIDLKCITGTKIKELLNYSWPMVPNNLSNWVLKLSDRLIITYALGIEANAVYAVANKIPNLLALGQNIIVMAWQENASIAIKDEDADQYFSSMFHKVFNIMIGLTILLLAFLPIIFNILIKGDYEESYFQIPILIYAMFFYCMSAFLGGIYIAHKKTKNIGITTIVAAIINLLIDVLLVNVCGVTAGSLSTLVAYLVLYLYRMIDLKHFQPMHFSFTKQIPLYILVIIMIILCYQKIMIFDLINLCIGISISCLINIPVLRGIFKHG